MNIYCHSRIKNNEDKCYGQTNENIHVRAFFNYITGGGGGGGGGGGAKPPAPMASQSPFSLKYKQNMEFRREVWYSSNWNLLCESYVMSFIFKAKHSVVNTLLDFKHFPLDCISQTI
jgi:hypothetical protein